MNYPCHKIELDILQTSSQAVLPIKRGDTGRKLRIVLTEGRAPYQIEDGCTAVFAARKSDGNKVYNDCVIENNAIFYTITPQTVASTGNVNCEIKLYDSDGLLITSPTFVLLVDAPVYCEGDITESAPEYLTIEKIVEEKLEDYAPSGGGAALTGAEKNLLLSLLKMVPYQADASATIKSLEAIWSSSGGGDSEGSEGVTYHSVTYDLTGVTAGNSAASVVSGGSLTVDLTPDTNAVLGEVTVTMGGEDITATAYSSGRISISSVTGDVVITAVAAVASYTQVDYLEATAENGVGFVTTYTPAATDLVECEFTSGNAVWTFPFCWSTANATCTFVTRFDGVAGRTGFTHRYGASYSNRNANDPDFAMPNTAGARYRLVESPLGTATLYDGDGAELVTLVDANADTCVDPASPVGLFAFFDNGEIRGNTSAKGLRIHSFKITDVYGATKLDVIPVLDADGVACMYDKISGEYFYDVSGSNTFTAGGAV